MAITASVGAALVDDVEVSGLVLEKFATPAQEGVISAYGSGWTITNNEIRLNHGCGVWSGSDSLVSNNFIHHNGQLGLCGQGKDILIEGNEIAFNNTAGFDSRWEAGGAKWVNTESLVVRNNYSHDNLGPGLWTDSNNIRTTYEGNVVEDNADEGIFHEISSRL